MIRTISQRLVGLFAGRKVDSERRSREAACVFETLDGRMLMSATPVDAITVTAGVNQANVEQGILQNVKSQLEADLNSVAKVESLKLSAFASLLSKDFNKLENLLKAELKGNGVQPGTMAQKQIDRDANAIVQQWVIGNFTMDGEFVKVQAKPQDDLQIEVGDSNNEGTPSNYSFEIGIMPSTAQIEMVLADGGTPTVAPWGSEAGK